MHTSMHHAVRKSGCMQDLNLAMDSQESTLRAQIQWLLMEENACAEPSNGSTSSLYCGLVRQLLN
jgi:hypothetical protein